MKKAYLDCSSGISGDMFLAVLIDAGLPLDRLLAELKKLPLGIYEFERTRAMRSGLVGTRVEIRIPGKQPHRKLAEIQDMLKKARLPTQAVANAQKVFNRLAEVEGKLHNVPPSEIHFHEVGAVDAILDIAGTCVGLELLEVSDLVCSPLNVGGGRVVAAHGSLPVPSPATAELLKNIPIYSSGVEAELVTPTGAALVSTLASAFGPLPAMKVENIGYGAGEKDFTGHPNIARLFIGEGIEAVTGAPGLPGDEVVSVIEANVDDLSPQLYGYFLEQALAAGALDVTCSSTQMKKNRPGLTISILCETAKSEALSHLLFEQTTTIGVRIYEARRKVLAREQVTVETPYGAVQVKVARREGKVVNAAPEFDDCHRLATEKSVPLKQVMLAAVAAYFQVGEKATVSKSGVKSSEV
jgi:pyridinium-3,5-bisthiocarboxylic acid mononucleotide nickel chelatase